MSIVRKILIRDRDVKIIAIGAELRPLPNWKNVSNEFEGRLLALGQISHESSYEYIRAAELALDSYPMSGGVALLNIVDCGCPVLSLVAQLDWVKTCSAFCADVDLLTSKAIELLKSEELRDSYIINQMDSEKSQHSTLVWQNNLNSILKNMPLDHQVKKSSKPTDVLELDFYHFCRTNAVIRKNIVDVANKIKIYKLKVGVKKKLVVEIFHFTFSFVYSVVDRL